MVALANQLIGYSDYENGKRDVLDIFGARVGCRLNNFWREKHSNAYVESDMSRDDTDTDTGTDTDNQVIRTISEKRFLCSF